MGESTCVIQQSFSYSGTHVSSQLRDPLSESISFGRFMTPDSSLVWDKWSNLTHKRYVEEAAKYSQPGSVAQKKAFFEDYYKKKALLAQENAAAAAQAIGIISQDQQCNENARLSEVDNVIEVSNEGKVLSSNGLVIGQDVFIEHNVIEATESNEKQSVSDADFLQQDEVTEHKVNEATESNEIQLASLEDVVDIGCPPEVLKADSEISTATSEISVDTEMEKPLLKERSANQEVTSNVKKPRPPPVPSSKPPATLWPSAKPVNRSRKENMTPLNNNTTSSAMESLEKVKASPKPLFSYMRTPARDRCTVNSSKCAKDISSTPLKTPSVAPRTKKSVVTPESENRRNMTQLESSTPGNRTTGAKWRYFGGLDFSACLSTTCRNKSRPSPTTSSPFNFRTEERAAKRKEKLELKFNATAPQKVQLQTKLKEKAESELKKLRQSLCFRARPLPSFYKERKTQKDDIPSTNSAEAEAPRLSKLQQTKMITKDVRKCSTPPPPPPKPLRPHSSQIKASNAGTAKKSTSEGLNLPRTLASMISNHNSPRSSPHSK